MLQTGIADLGDQLPVHTSARRYERHRPEQTLLYQIVDKHYPEFLAQTAAEGKSLPDYVQQEFTDFLKCGLLEHGFIRVRCESCHHERKDNRLDKSMSWSFQRGFRVPEGFQC